MKQSDIYEVYRYPDTPDPVLRKRIERLRYRGYKGGYIVKHRALLTSPRGIRKVLSAAGLAAGFLAAWLLAMKWVSSAWAQVMAFWTDVLGIHGYVTLIHYRFAGVFGFYVPYVHVRSATPDFVQLVIGAVITIVLVLVSLVLPRRLLPVIYALRVIALFQACAQIFFTFVPWPFPYGASGYIHGVLIASLALISLVPVVLGFTYFIFDFTLRKKAGLALIIMGYLCFLIPLQYTVHGFVLYHSSLLFLPILFFVFGLPLNVMMFIAFYSWGASWKSMLYVEDAPRGNGFF